MSRAGTPFVAFLVGLLATGCAIAGHHGRAVPGGCSAAEEGTVLTILFFGLSSGDGRGVSEQAWDRFLRETVTPRFPAGLTVVPAYGQYAEGEKGPVRTEHTRLLILSHPATRRDDESIGQIAAEYKKQFDQDAVLRVRMDTCRRFE